MPEPSLLRSYLYAPGSSERILSKVVDAGADAIVLDLEDSVAPARKADARDAVVAFLDQHGGTTTAQLHVRVNVGGHGFDGADVRAIVRPGLAAIRIPKCEDVRAVRLLDTILSNLERERGLDVGSIRIHPLLESAAGVEAAGDIAGSSRVDRLCFGAADFLADIGGRGPGHGQATLYARSRMVLASRVAGIGPPVDSVHTQLDDLDGLRESAVLARDLGFSGKSVIHPAQLDVVHEVFTPSEEEVAWAKGVVAAFEGGLADGEVALAVDGEFIDPAVVSRARGVLALAEEQVR